jgi:hypothetical protein
MACKACNTYACLWLDYTCSATRYRPLGHGAMGKRFTYGTWRFTWYGTWYGLKRMRALVLIAYMLSMVSSVRYSASKCSGEYQVFRNTYGSILGHPVTITGMLASAPWCIRRNAPQLVDCRAWKSTLALVCAVVVCPIVALTVIRRAYGLARLRFAVSYPLRT